jgi:hypothetical protein
MFTNVKAKRPVVEAEMSAMNFFNRLLLCSVNILFTFVGIFLNSIVIISLMNSQLRRKLCYFMIRILACFDLAVVAVFHPTLALASLDIGKRTFMVGGQLQILSLAAMLTMTMERYIALTFSFFHQRFVTKTRLIVLVVILQLPFTVVHTAAHMDTNVPIVAVFLALIGGMFLATFFLNYKILLVARRLRRSTMIIPLGEFTEQTCNNRKHTVALKKISTCSLAVACLAVCHAPHVVYLLLILTGQLSNCSVSTACPFHLWADTLTALNSSFNCVIFFYINSTLRRHGWQMVRHFKNLCVRPRDLNVV